MVDCGNFPSILDPSINYCAEQQPCPQGFRKVPPDVTASCCESIVVTDSVAHNLECCTSIGVDPFTCAPGLCPGAPLCNQVIYNWCLQDPTRFTNEDLCACFPSPLENEETLTQFIADTPTLGPTSFQDNETLIVPQFNAPKWCWSEECRRSSYFLLFGQTLPGCAYNIFNCTQIVNATLLNTELTNSVLASNCDLNLYNEAGQLRNSTEWETEQNQLNPTWTQQVTDFFADVAEELAIDPVLVIVGIVLIVAAGLLLLVWAIVTSYRASRRRTRAMEQDMDVWEASLKKLKQELKPRAEPTGKTK